MVFKYKLVKKIPKNAKIVFRANDLKKKGYENVYYRTKTKGYVINRKQIR